MSGVVHLDRVFGGKVDRGPTRAKRIPQRLVRFRVRALVEHTVDNDSLRAGLVETRDHSRQFLATLRRGGVGHVLVERDEHDFARRRLGVQARLQHPGQLVERFENHPAQQDDHDRRRPQRMPQTFGQARTVLLRTVAAGPFREGWKNIVSRHDICGMPDKF